jgi:hypothetical protein
MSGGASEDLSIAGLLALTLREGRALVRVEVALAKDEALCELAGVRRAAALLAIALTLAAASLALLAVALVLALRGGALVMACVGGSMLLGALTAGALAARAAPSGVLTESRARVEADLRRIKEAIE